MPNRTTPCNEFPGNKDTALMNITSAEAEKMVDEQMAREAAQAQPTEDAEKLQGTSQEEPEKVEQTEETEGAEVKDAEVPQETTKDSPQESEDKSKTETDPEESPKKQKYTQSERINHAFQLEKAKRKAEKEKRQRLQAENEQLKKELEKYKGLNLQDFGDKVDDYVDYRLKEQSMRSKVEANEAEIRRSEEDEVAAERERRIALSFDTEEERSEYRQLMEGVNGQAFFKAIADKDEKFPGTKNAFVGYLSSVEQFPKVLKELMTNEKALREVFRDNDPEMLRINLSQFTHNFLSGKVPGNRQDEPKPTAQPAPAPKPAIPVIGKQTTSSTSAPEPDYSSRDWANEHLKRKPKG